MGGTLLKAMLGQPAWSVGHPFRPAFGQPARAEGGRGRGRQHDAEECARAGAQGGVGRRRSDEVPDDESAVHRLGVRQAGRPSFKMDLAAMQQRPRQYSGTEQACS